MPMPDWLVRILRIDFCPPWLARFGKILASVVFVALGSGLLVLVAETDTLLCSRPTGQCTLTQERLTGTSTRQFLVSALKDAKLSGRRMTLPQSLRIRNTPSRSVAFLVGNEEVFFTTFDTGFFEDQMNRQVQEVRRYLASPLRPALQIQQDTRMLGTVAGGIVLLFGVAMLVAALKGR